MALQTPTLHVFVLKFDTVTNPVPLAIRPFCRNRVRLAAFLVETFLFYGHHNKKRAYQILKWAWSREPHTTITVCSHLIGKSRQLEDFVFTYKADADVPKKYKLTDDD